MSGTSADHTYGRFCTCVPPRHRRKILEVTPQRSAKVTPIDGEAACGLLTLGWRNLTSSPPISLLNHGKKAVATPLNYSRGRCGFEPYVVIRRQALEVNADGNPWRQDGGPGN